MQKLESKAYAKTLQAVRDKELPAATKIVFTEIGPSFDNPWHPCPAPQFVTVLSGTWWVETSDGMQGTSARSSRNSEGTGTDIRC
eukprot:scaffold4280_cov385-Prasinococcus_capsulatus_cf.AAC.8